MAGLAPEEVPRAREEAKTKSCWFIHPDHEPWTSTFTCQNTSARGRFGDEALHTCMSHPGLTSENSPHTPTFCFFTNDLPVTNFRMPKPVLKLVLTTWTFPRVCETSRALEAKSTLISRSDHPTCCRWVIQAELFNDIPAIGHLYVLRVSLIRMLFKRCNLHFKGDGDEVVGVGRKGPQLNSVYCFISWLMHYATSQKVADSNPDEVIGFFQLTYSFQPHYGPGVDSEMSTRNLPGG
jgi:hypothetical protein